MSADPLQRDLLAALLREVAVCLRAFAETGMTAVIDLGALPLGRADREALDAALGRGEVAATIESAGNSEIWETVFAGVWRVRHNGAEHVAVDQIEIGPCPHILQSDPRDAGAAARRLEQTTFEALRGDAA
jgi:hydrogenase-1 operon protein HyaF